MFNVSSEHSFNSLYFELVIHTWFKWGIYTPHETPTSNFHIWNGLEVLVLVLDRRRR